MGAFWASMPGIRPLLKLSYAVNHAIGGFHAFNIAVHVANVLVVYALFAVRGRAAAALATMLFALAPVQTEAVTYVSGRSTSLSALFALGSVLAWTKGRRTFLSPALFAAALAVKETAIVVPLAIVLWELTDCERRASGRHGLRALRGHAAVVLLAAIAAAVSPTYRHLAATSLEARSLSSNLATQAEAIPYLARQMVRPDLLNADPGFDAATGWSFKAVLLATAIVALIGFGFTSLRRRPDVALGILWFFLWLAPTNSVLPRLDVVNDRQVYVALIGPAWLVGVALAKLRKPALVGSSVALALVLGTATLRRNEVYRSETTFWEDVVAKSPDNARAFNNLGYAYAIARRDADAESAFRRALAIDPAYVRAGVNLRLLREGALTGANSRP